MKRKNIYLKFDNILKDIKNNYNNDVSILDKYNFKDFIISNRNKEHIIKHILKIDFELFIHIFELLLLNKDISFLICNSNNENILVIIIKYEFNIISKLKDRYIDTNSILIPYNKEDINIRYTYKYLYRVVELCKKYNFDIKLFFKNPFYILSIDNVNDSNLLEYLLNIV